MYEGEPPDVPNPELPPDGSTANGQAQGNLGQVFRGIFGFPGEVIGQFGAGLIGQLPLGPGPAQSPPPVPIPGQLQMPPPPVVGPPPCPIQEYWI
jgi:hypothetical protein